MSTRAQSAPCAARLLTRWRHTLSDCGFHRWRIADSCTHERDGRVVACGQFALEGTIAGLYDVFTATDARGQGLASALCVHLLQHALGLGAQTAYLQVDANNLTARSVYARLGFADAYAYHYRARVAPLA